MSKKAIHWSGVFPAVSTQFRSDYSLDLDATHAVMKNLVKDGVSGLVVCGSVGENTSLSTDEKLQIIEVAKIARRRAGHRLELAAKGAVIGIPALQGDIVNLRIASQQFGRFFQPHFVDHLPRSEMKDPFAVAFDLRNRHPA